MLHQKAKAKQLNGKQLCLFHLHNILSVLAVFRYSIFQPKKIRKIWHQFLTITTTLRKLAAWILDTDKCEHLRNSYNISALMYFFYGRKNWKDDKSWSWSSGNIHAFDKIQSQTNHEIISTKRYYPSVWITWLRRSATLTSSRGAKRNRVHLDCSAGIILFTWLHIRANLVLFVYFSITAVNKNIQISV